MKKFSDSGSSSAPDLEEIGELLEKLWEIAPDERDDWLNENCPSGTLRDEVRSLMDADEAAGYFLGPEAVERTRPLIEAAVTHLEQGSRIGRFRIVRRIARGGMGEVFLAERDGDDFEQTVAIKLAHRFNDTAERRRRFLEERQILARLEHPSIARLIDGGIWEIENQSESGRPFLVMEYVDGLPINEYCFKAGLDLHARLNLFQTVCDAVHYAHQNLIIHRDLKPSNILVTKQGQVKLLDFGIATMLSQDSVQAESESLLLTPEFAAPEQLRGEPLTTATDVYALGLLLYELVSDRRAHVFDGDEPEDMIRRVCETPETPPSQVLPGVSPPPWLGRAKGDLDCVVLRALEKAPGSRYTSARALSEDVQNFLDGMPVAAHADSRRYRISKFISRNRWETISASVAAVLLVAATIVTAVSAASAKKALNLAQIEARKSAQVVGFLRDTYSAADLRQTDGEKLGVEDVLESGLTRIDELSEQPEVQGLLLSELGVIYTSLGNHETGVELLKSARTLLGETTAENHDELARTLLSWSIAEERIGNLEASEELARELLDIQQAAQPVNEAAVGVAMDRLGTAISGQGRYQDAEPLMVGAVERLTRDAGELDPRTLTALHNLAWLQGRLGQLEQAVETYRRVVAVGEKIHGANDPDLLVSRDSLAVALRRVGRLDEAEQIFREVLARRIELLGEPHWEVGYTYHNLARLLFEVEAHDQAVVLYGKALENWEPTLGVDHANVGLCLANLARAHEALGNRLDAEESYQRAVTILDGEAGFEDRLAEAREGLQRVSEQTLTPSFQGDG